MYRAKLLVGLWGGDFLEPHIKTRAVFLGTQEVHVLRRTFGHDITAESGLEEFELRERQPDEPAITRNKLPALPDLSSR